MVSDSRQADAQFEVIKGFERSPHRISRDTERVETPTSIKLAELPLGTIISFEGQHPASIYYCLLALCDAEKKIKVWLNRQGNGAVGPLDAVVSFNMRKLGTEERGVMELGKQYLMPLFVFGHEGNLTLNYAESRTEAYKQLYVLRPRV